MDAQGDLEELTTRAKVKLIQVSQVWRHVRGPGLATVASCARLNWHVVDATTMVPDRGCTLHLELDFPAVVKVEVREAAKRW